MILPRPVTVPFVLDLGLGRLTQRGGLCRIIAIMASAIRIRGSLTRWIAAGVLGLLALVALAAWGIGWIGVPRGVGYFSPIFARDGRSVFAITRDARAAVTGFGQEFFTAPASVRMLRDRFTLINLQLSDGRMTVVEAFPPSPLDGQQFRAYRPSIFGTPRAHLRWADADHLDYEIAVTRHDTPSSRTFVIRRRWNPATRTYETTPPWQEGYASMSGDEPDQLHGDLEAIAVPGEHSMPCAIAILRRGETRGRALIETGVCREKYPSGLSADVLTPLSRRADIERIEHIKKTYAELVERGRASGRPEGQARLDAGEEMSRLGLFPKTTKLVARETACEGASPLFHISTEEFTVGLFQDIEKAIAAPDTEVNKSMGSYTTHSDYATSRQINEFVDAGNSTFFVETRGTCWRLTINRP